MWARRTRRHRHVRGYWSRAAQARSFFLSASARCYVIGQLRACKFTVQERALRKGEVAHSTSPFPRQSLSIQLLHPLLIFRHVKRSPAKRETLARPLNVKRVGGSARLSGAMKKGVFDDNLQPVIRSRAMFCPTCGKENPRERKF